MENVNELQCVETSLSTLLSVRTSANVVMFKNAHERLGDLENTI